MSASAPEISGVAPEALSRLSIEALKYELARGSLLALLQRELESGGEKNRLAAIRLVQEGYESESSFLRLRLDFSSPACERELLVRYPYPGDPYSGKPARAWCFPQDPWLPVLAKLDRSRDFVRQAAWKEPWGRIFPQGGEISVERLLYNPGRRATFLLTSPQSGAKLILKIVRPADFRECLRKVKAIQSSSLCERIALPRRVSHSTREHAFLYEYVPGLRIDRFQALGANQNAADLLDGVAGVAAEIHRNAIPQLPLWRPQAEADATRSLLGSLEARDPAAWAAIRPLFERTFGSFAKSARPYAQVIHNSFSAKHIFCHADGPGSGAPVKLAIIDWDSAALGPREKDLGSFLSGFPERKKDCLLFLERYRERSGFAPDLELVNGFLQYRRLLKVCRQILRNGDADGTSSDAIRAIGERLQHNPLLG